MSRILDFADGFESSVAPSVGSVTSSSYKVFVDDTAFVADKGSAAAEGDVYWNSTSDRPRVYTGAAWVYGVTQSVLNFLVATQAGSYVDDAAFVAAKGSAAQDGDYYLNTTNNLPRFRANSTWLDMVVSGVAQTITGNKTFSNNVIITGDLTVNGTSTTLNTATLDVEDAQINVNKGGNQASADALAGIKVEMSDATHVTIKYDSTLASKWKAGNEGAEVELANVSSAQALSNKSISGDSNTITNLAISTLKTVLGNANKFLSFDVTGAPVASKAVPTGDVLGTSDAQVVTGKDIDGGTASDTSRITLPKNTTANLNGLTRKEATLVYDTTTATVKYDDGVNLNEIGSGSGAGRVNFLSGDSANFKNTVGNWATFDDGAVSTPVDLTGGSASVLSATRSTAFDSTGGMRISHTAADGQGEGVSVALATIESKYFASVMDIEFTYKSSSTYADDKLEVWIYDVTNATLIQPSSYKIKASLVPSKFKAQFQTSATGTSYRVGFFCPNTTATAYDFDLDDVVVGPSIYNYGMPGYDPKDYTPTLAGLGTGSATVNYCRHSRSGKFLLIDFRFTKDGSGGSGATSVSFTLPSGILIDNSITQNYFGGCAGSGATTNSSFDVYYDPSTNTVKFLQNDGSSFTGSEWTASSSIGGFIKIPVLGWSSSVQMSSDADQRECSFAAYKAADQTGVNPNNSAVKLQFDTKSGSSVAYDTHGAFDNVTNYRFTAQTSGRHEFTANIQVAGTNVLANIYQLRLYVNGGFVKVLDEYTPSVSERFNLNGSFQVNLNANDYVEVYIYGAGNNSVSTLTIFGGSNGMGFTGKKIQGPSAIGATETISLIAYKNTGNHSSTGNLQDVASWTTVADDSHGQFNSTTGVYTVAAPGRFAVSGVISFTANATGTRRVVVLQNSTAKISGSTGIANASNAARMSYSGILKCVAGDTVKIQAFQDSGGNLNYNANDFDNVFCITRIGV